MHINWSNGSTPEVAPWTCSWTFGTKRQCKVKACKLFRIPKRKNICIQRRKAEFFIESILWLGSDSAVRLRGGRSGNRHLVSGRWRDFSSVISVQVGSNAHPASCINGNRGSLWGRPEREADHSSPSSAEVNIAWRSLCIHCGLRLHSVMLN
jgi:hypothetical protein